MTEKEYNIEVLCTGYSLEDLISQQKKIGSKTLPAGYAVIDVATFEEISMAISSYNDERYRNIRDEMRKECEKYNI